MQPFITQNLDAIIELCRKHCVARLAVFGSSVRDDFDPQHSDVDLLVAFQQIDELAYADNFFALLHSLDDLFARKVDLVTDKYVLNPYLRKTIEADKVELYAAA